MSQQAEQQVSPRRGPKVPPFGTTVDPREAGRKGGLATAERRRLRPIQEAKRLALRSRNGAAAVAVAKMEMAEQAELLAERMRRDEIVSELIVMESQLLHEVERLTTQREQARSELVELLGRQDLLRASVDASESALVVRLRELHDHELLEPALEKLGLFERVDES